MSDLYSTDISQLCHYMYFSDYFNLFILCECYTCWWCILSIPSPQSLLPFHFWTYLSNFMSSSLLFFFIFSPISISSILWAWVYDYLLYQGNIPQVTPLKKDDSPWTNSHQQREVPHWRFGSLNSFTKARNLSGLIILAILPLGKKGKSFCIQCHSHQF